MDYGYDTGSALATGVGAVFGILAFIWIVILAIGVFAIVCNWKVFKKAGKKGWESIIPIYNIIVLLQIIDKPIWYLLFLFIPGIGGLIFSILVYFELAKKFGQSFVFGIGLVLLNPIFMAILAFDKKCVYQDGMNSGNTQTYENPIGAMNAEQSYQQSVYNQPVEQPVDNEQINQPVEQPVQNNVCPKCGIKVNAGDKFCMNCGSQL